MTAQAEKPKNPHDDNRGMGNYPNPPKGNGQPDSEQVKPTTATDRRAELMAICAMIIESGDYDHDEENEKEQGKNIVNNKVLASWYCSQANSELVFNSFAEWQKQGFQVKKGAKAYLFWAKPHYFKKLENGTLRRIYEHELQEGEKIEKVADLKYFNVAYLFSNLQVTERSKK